jgi:hypothetical protein
MELSYKTGKLLGKWTGEVVVVVVWSPICANCAAISTGPGVTGQFSFLQAYLFSPDGSRTLDGCV